jgi:hypothetical protein
MAALTGAEGLLSRIHRRLGVVERRMERPVRVRPWWQRIVLPLIGLALVVAGIVFTFTPVPLMSLALVGFPMLFCFNPRLEGRARAWMSCKLGAIRRRLRTWRRRMRRRARQQR